MVGFRIFAVKLKFELKVGKIKNAGPGIKSEVVMLRLKWCKFLN